MRIVMLTDDVQIDRRILLEAEALIDVGHEVILLAGESPREPRHHLAGSVKVERARPAPLIETACDHYVDLSDRAVTKVATWNERFRLRTQRWRRPLGTALREVSRGGAWAAGELLVLQSKAARRGVKLLGRLDNRLRRLDGRERHLVDRIRFYRPDVIHAHDLPQLRPAVVAKRALHVPLVYDAHELYPDIHTLRPRWKRVLARREATCIHSCDRVITVNGYIARIMAERYGIPEPAVILNATAPPPGFDERERYDRFRTELPIPRDAVIVLYQGWMSLDRGLDPLLRSMALVTNPRVHLVMMGYGEGRDVLPPLARDLGLGHRIHFKDAVPQSELLFWTASADAGIIPYPPVDLNNYLCSPNKLFEFITARLPIIANDLPFLRDVVAGNDFGVVRKLDTPADFAAAIDSMFADIPGGTEHFRRSLIRSGNRFGWSVQQEKLLSLYGQFAAPQHAVASGVDGGEVRRSAALDRAGAMARGAQPCTSRPHAR
jgi:glycosyltransferase involved in cell wall biosynthesis